MRLIDELKYSSFDKFDMVKRKENKPPKPFSYVSLFDIATKSSEHAEPHERLERED